MISQAFPMNTSSGSHCSVKCCSLTYDLFLPAGMFAALGGMTWAVRGCSGFGAVAGCLFAGVMWGAAWWYMAYEPSGKQVRRYSSAWIVLAVTLGVGLSGARGWMQWPTFFEGHLQTNTGKGEWVPISRGYGYLWMFIAGMPWAGLGACALAWCGSLRETRVWHWGFRIFCGIGAAVFARYLYDSYPSFFLPLYDDLKNRYEDTAANPNLRRLLNDCGAAVVHMGFYLGFLLYEILRRDWKNTVLILTVGIVNGAGWAGFQTWKFSAVFWPDTNFNFWRCWESSGGISIGIAYGLAWFLVNRRMTQNEFTQVSQRTVSAGSFEWFLIFCGLTAFAGALMQFQMAGWSVILVPMLFVFSALYCLRSQRKAGGEHIAQTPLFIPVTVVATAFSAAHLLPLGGTTLIIPGYILSGIAFIAGVIWFLDHQSCEQSSVEQFRPAGTDLNLQQFALALGLITGLGLSIRNGAKGWFNIYIGNEDFWSAVLWWIVGPLLVVSLFLLIRRTLRQRHSPCGGDISGVSATTAFWLVLIVQNVLGHLVTGPPTQWNEVVFNIYYLLLFLITAVITVHYQARQHQSNDVDFTVQKGERGT
jgi:hypothetical protein